MENTYEEVVLQTVMKDILQGTRAPAPAPWLAAGLGCGGGCCLWDLLTLGGGGGGCPGLPGGVS